MMEFEANKARKRQISEFIETIDDIGWKYTTSAVEKIIDTAYERKEIIRNILRNHENWNEELQGVVFSADYTRRINNIESSAFCDWVHNHLRNKYPRSENGYLTDDYYNASDIAFALLKPSQFITDENDICYINEKCALVEDLKKFHVHSNQKRSRAVGKFCKALGFDTLPDYNEQFAKYGDSVNPLKVTRWTKISIDMVDFLNMSNGTSWSSCHNPNKGEYGGCHCSGGISHGLDEFSIIMYTVDAAYNGNELEMQRKTDRCIFFVDTEYKNQFVQSKVYPDNSEDKSKDYREIFQAVWSKCLGVPNYWVSRNNICNEVGIRLINNEDGSTIYPDWDDTRSKRIMHCRLKGVELNNCRTMYVGANPICVECGWEHDIAEQINCCHEFHGAVCPNCDSDLSREDDIVYSEFYDAHGCRNCMTYNEYCNDWFYDSDDVEYVPNIGEYVPVCYMEDRDDFAQCEECGEWIYVDSYYGGYYETDWGNVYCESCFEENYVTCVDCGEVVRIEDAIEIGCEYYCDDCVTTCDKCGQIFPEREATEIDGMTVCPECADELENADDGVA